MANARQNGRKKYSIRKIRIEVEQDREQQIRVNLRGCPEVKAKSTWGWHEEFARDWCETLITRKGEKHRK